jgi:serine/threonine-protein kinase
MALTIGQHLGSYEIVALLGKGGMGEVYRARDAKLKRQVAIKILPDEFARDMDRVGRFQREAQVLASLNHPNIAAIYDLQEANDTRFLVLELVEGETLADRIRRGPIRVEEALAIANHICEALEAAHERGVIHRDLKPANVKITPDGKVKVLDFGLAKALTPGTPRDLMSSPTLTGLGTNAGVILGTAPYMSPEQAKGLDADLRSDIFSFGTVLYEMLTGRQPFQGDSITEIIASVLAREPDLRALPANIHPRLEELLRRCLEKNVKRRRQTIADIRIEIEAMMADPHGLKFQSREVEHRPIWKRAIPFIATAVAIAALTVATMRILRPLEHPRVTRFPFVLPEGERFSRTGRHMIAVSPDGANVVYVANQQLYIRTMAELKSHPMQGTALDVDTPFFSPDGSWIAFHSSTENKLKKIAITGGAAITICDSLLPFGASWAPDGTILIGAGPAGILRVSANGGKPDTVVAVKAGETAHGPQLLPGGDGILFTLAKGANLDRWDKAQIVVQSLKSGERKVLFDGGSDARYSPTGHMVYALGSTVLARPFDVKSLQFTGSPAPVIEGVFRPAAQTGAANFSFSDEGSMAYIGGGTGSSSAGGRILALVDRSGARKQIPIPPANYFNPRISPNGKQLAVNTDDGKDVAVWIYDLAGTNSMRRLTFGSANRFPLWTSDGLRVVFQSDREKDFGLFWQRADGNGPAERLTKPDIETSNHTPDSWSPDGKTLLFSVWPGGGDASIWSVSIGRDSKASILIDSTATSTATNESDSSFSPDGHWVAYRSNVPGRPEQNLRRAFPRHRR